MARNSLRLPRSRATLAAAALWLLAGCTSTSLVEKWQDAAFSGPPLQQLLVVSVERSDGRRRLFEDGMTAALARQSIRATASYTLLPDSVPQSAELSATAKREGYDGVLVLHQLGSSTHSNYTPGSLRSYTVAVPTLNGQYTQVWQTIYEPGYSEIEQRLDYQTDLFDTATGRLAWSATTRSIDLSSAKSITDDISRRVLPEMMNSRLLAATPEH
jgi:hypothetical protein